MPFQLCPIAIRCPAGVANDPSDADSPIANFSSEAPDQLLFGDTGFPFYFPDNPITPDPTGTDPGFPSLYYAQGCVAPCYATTAAGAAQCAANQAIECAHQKQQIPPLVPNTTQFCSFTCPDGTLFTWTVAAGYVIMTNQDTANAVAKQIACQNAAAHFMCLPAISGGCAGSQYSQTIPVTAGVAVVQPLTFTITGGALPPGLFLSQSANTAFITGTPTTPGSYVFTLQVQDANGNVMQKNYTLGIVGVSNLSSLPTAMENTPYSFQLTGTGGTAPYTFALVSGTLPGITLSSSGLLSGTPNYVTAGKYPFTVAITDSTGKSCPPQSATLTVTLRPGPDWTKLVWTAYPLVQGNGTAPASSATGNAVSNTAFGTLHYANGLNPFPSIGPVAASGVTYTGPQVTSRIILTISFSGNCGIAEVCRVFSSLAGQIGGYSVSDGSGTFTFDFIVPASVNAAMTIDDAGSTFVGLNQIFTHGDFSFTWAIVNV